MENGVGDTAILSDTCIMIVWHIIVAQDDIFQEGIRVDGSVNIGLGFLAQVNGLGIASSFKVEDTVLVPAVFVITNQGAVRVGRQRSLTGSTQTEEQSNISLLSNIS